MRSQVPKNKPSVRTAKLQNEETLHVKSELREGGKNRVEQFRKIAHELLGEKAFTSAKGTSFLDLGRAELKFLAEHPGKTEAAIKKLQAEGQLPKNNEHFRTGEMVKLIRHAARDALRRSGTFTVATINDDFTDRKTSLNRVNREVNPDVMLLQEAKNSNIAKDAGKGLGAYQNNATEGHAGSAIVWDENEAKAGARGTRLGVDPPKGVGMLNRYITYTDVKIEGRSVRMISAHRPPKRFAEQWPAFDRALAAFVKSTKGPVIVGMDANERTPEGLERATGLKWHSPGPKSIDGFLVSPGIEVSNIRRLAKGVSDHHPVVADFRFKK